MSWDNFFIIVLFGIPILLVLYGMFDWVIDIKDLFSLRAKNIHEKEIRQKGHKNEAVVKSILQTGLFVNENPEVELILINNNNGMEITIRTVVSLVMIPRLQPDCTVVIFVNPENPSEATLEH